MKTDRLINYLRSGFSTFWLKTDEPNRVRQTIYPMLQNFQLKDGSQFSIREWSCTNEDPNPLSAINFLRDATNSILFLYNYHWYIDKPQTIQTIQDCIPVWQNNGNAVIIVSPVEKIPVELSKDIVVMHMPLPNKKEIGEAVNHTLPEGRKAPEGTELDRIISACTGLTRVEVETVLALSFVDTDGKKFGLSTINEYKGMSISKTGFLDILKGDVTFSDIIGYNIIKDFILDSIDNPKAKGVMTIGPPGCGKTTLMKAVVGETGMFGLQIRMGKLFSKYQGETDQNVNTVIDLITAVGKCFLLIDEFEKQFAGAGGSGELDSGVTKRASSRWLEFLQDRPKGVYVCGTANSFEGIPAEYLRVGRWDSSPFYISLPNQKTRSAILKHYCKKEEVDYPTAKTLLPKTVGWSGAEIEGLVHIASMRGISLVDAAKSIIPQSKTMADKLARLKEWAENNCVHAEEAIQPSSTKRRLDI